MLAKGFAISEVSILFRVTTDIPAFSANSYCVNPLFSRSFNNFVLLYTRPSSFHFYYIFSFSFHFMTVYTIFQTMSIPHKTRYYSFSPPTSSDHTSSVLPLLPAFHSSAPSIFQSSNCTIRQSNATTHLTFQQVPTPNIILSATLSNKFFSTSFKFLSSHESFLLP